LEARPTFKWLGGLGQLLLGVLTTTARPSFDTRQIFHIIGRPKEKKKKKKEEEKGKRRGED
jgi:hypothetical protein